MKRLMIILMAFFLFNACATKKITETTDLNDFERTERIDRHYLWVYKPQINVRINHSADSEQIAQLADGDSVIFVSNINGWYQVKLNDNRTGWIRSDLLGPKNLSAFRAAVAFVDSLKEFSNVSLYFDKNLYHKRIYLTFPPGIYQTKSAVKIRTEQILERYQRKVYKGEVSARVLKPSTEEEFLTVNRSGEINSEPLLPIIPFGRIKQIDRSDPDVISLVYVIPRDIPEQKLLPTARNLSAEFPLSYKKVQIRFLSENEKKQPVCRLWFQEGQTGEQYKFDPCD